MRSFLIAAAALGLLLGMFAAVHVEAAPPVPPNATTATNVCVVYSVDGVYSGGIPVLSPSTVSYRYNGNDGAFLWLAGWERLKVDTLTITPITYPGECVGIF